MSFIVQEDGYYALTSAGIILFAVIAVALLVITGFVKAAARSKEENRNATAGSIFTVRQLVFSAIAIAIAFALSYVKIIHMPWGGSVTLCSMLFITMVGYWYGPKIGIIVGFTYGILQFIQGGGDYILSPMQICLDYIVAFAALGLSGFFSKFKNGLTVGFLVGIAARGAFHALGGYLYWMEYMPENFPASLAAIYPILYNYAYILVEGIITLILINIPAVKKALERVKILATMK